jgi:putative transposase
MAKTAKIGLMESSKPLRAKVRMIFVGQASLRRAVAEYVDHYHRERNHQGLENRLIHAPAVVAANEGAIYRHARLGGTLNFYYRQAA